MAKPSFSNIMGGISQKDRFPVSLRYDFFKIEERSVETLLRFMIDISREFNYYDLNNKVAGDWLNFLLSDINVLIRVIPKFDILAYIKEFDGLKAAVTEEDNDLLLITRFQQLLFFLKDFVLVQYRISGRMAAAAFSGDKRIADLQQSAAHYYVFDEDIRLLQSYFLYAQELLGNRFNPDFDMVDFPVTGIAKDGDVTAFWGSTTEPVKDKLVYALRHMDSLFATLRLKLHRLLAATEFYASSQDAVSYAPHTGLVITFLHLYQYLEKEINTITKKHLDFFYRQVLGIRNKTFVPDSVYLIIGISTDAGKILVKAGERLPAGVKEPVGEVYYKVDNDSLVTTAKVCELKSVYVSENVKLIHPGEDVDDLKEQEVFAASYAVTDPVQFIKEDNKTLKTWPLMGEEQESKPLTERTMVYADMGLTISSPLFYLKDGKRHISLRFYLEERSYNVFKKYTTGYATAIGINDAASEYEILKNAFTISITTTDGWLPVKEYSCFCSEDRHNEKFFQVSFRVSEKSPVIDIYNPLVHGAGFEEKWPLLQLTLNNYSFYHPYLFFKGLMIERVGIKVKVQDAGFVKLQNNIGTVSTGSPFQLFGPQPAVGTYLDIKNTNIFNRYTRSLAIKINWFDLPKEKGGFATYFDAYGNGVTNSSYKVAISSINGNKYVPEAEDQQAFDLFTTSHEPGRKQLLDTFTEIDEIDVKRMQLMNEPLLQQEELVAETTFRDGAVRIELVAPDDAFGHKLFPVIFPEVIMNNARRWAKKKPIPNQPYVPMVKSLSVDYILEHSEIIREGARRKDAENIISIIHRYPFGLHKVYPGVNKYLVHLVPFFNNDCNLLIGLCDVQPGTEISLLFQLDESNFSGSLYDEEIVQWSYLLDNEWIAFSKAEVLADTTYNFIKTGTVRLQVPELICKGNTILNPDLYWLKASCSLAGNIRAKVIAVYAQAIKATRMISEAIPGKLSIPAGAITEFKNKLPYVLDVIQPFASFGGKSAETETAYYTRVSEILRHKQRPVGTKDICQIILERFPELLKVKCYGSGGHNNILLPGKDIQVVVVPRRKENRPWIDNEPKVDISTLYDIRKYISASISSFIKVDVQNPVYERVKVVCSIIFNNRVDKQNAGDNINRLNEDIRKFISPWLYDADSDFKMDTRMYLSELLNFIKNCSYIGYVTSFSVLHFYHSFNVKNGKYTACVADSARDKTDYLQGSFPGAILIPSDEHLVTVIEKPEYRDAAISGINNLFTGNELLVSEEWAEQPVVSTSTIQDIQEDIFNYQFTINP